MATKISIFRGTTYTVTYHHTDDTGAAVDLTGSTIYFTVKSDQFDTDATDTTALIKKTVVSHTDATHGLSAFTLDDSDTYVEPGKYYYSLIVEDGNGHAAPPSLYGRFEIEGHATNRNVGNE